MTITHIPATASTMQRHWPSGTTEQLFQHTMLAGIDYALPKHESERYNRDVGNLDYYSPVYGSALGAATPASFSWKSDMQRLGLYTQDQMKIADKWVVLLGGRQDYVRYSEKSFFTGEKTIDDEKSKAFSDRAGLVYLADNGLAPFLSYSESFEPSDGSDRRGKRFKPTTGRQYEVGLRYQPKGSDTLVSATAYQLTQDNVLVSDPVDSNFSIQSGRVRSRGFELEARPPAWPPRQADRRLRLYRCPHPQGQLAATGTGRTTCLFGALQSNIPLGQWKFALNITNLTDKTYIASCTYGCFYGEPRKAIVSANYRW